MQRTLSTYNGGVGFQQVPNKHTQANQNNSGTPSEEPKVNKSKPIDIPNANPNANPSPNEVNSDSDWSE